MTLPGDKSISHRALMFLSMACGEAVIQNLSSGQDVQSTLACLRLLGAQIEALDETTWHITGVEKFHSPPTPLDCGNSGTTMRLLSGIIAGTGLAATLIGDASLQKRPMKRVIDPLMRMGASIQNQCPPLQFKDNPAGLTGIDYRMPIASAQVKSAILLAGLFTQPGCSVEIEEPVPSRDHTERMLTALGAQVDCGQKIQLRGRKSDLISQNILVPGDISSAAFWLVGAAILPGSHLTLQQVSLNPSRLGLLKVLQAQVEQTGVSAGEPYGTIQITGGSLSGDITITPDMVPELIDEIPILTVLGLFTEGTFTLHGAEELKFKESNRLQALLDILAALDIDVEPYDDGFRFQGNPDWQVPSTQTPFETHHDHRLVMALEILNLRAASPLPIQGKDWVAISYPGFYNTLHRLRTNLSTKP